MDELTTEETTDPYINSESNVNIVTHHNGSEPAVDAPVSQEPAMPEEAPTEQPVEPAPSDIADASAPDETAGTPDMGADAGVDTTPAQAELPDLDFEDDELNRYMQLERFGDAPESIDDYFKEAEINNIELGLRDPNTLEMPTSEDPAIRKRDTKALYNVLEQAILEQGNPAGNFAASFMLNSLNAIGLGWGDEFLAQIENTADEATYEESLEYYKILRDAYSVASPAGYLAGEVVSIFTNPLRNAALSMKAAAKAGMKLVNTVGADRVAKIGKVLVQNPVEFNKLKKIKQATISSTTRTGSDIRKALTESTATGGVAGAGSADESNSAGRFTGAVTGAAIGLVLPGASEGVTAAGSALRRKMSTPTTSRILTETAELAGKSPEDLQAISSRVEGGALPTDVASDDATLALAEDVSKFTVTSPDVEANKVDRLAKQGQEGLDAVTTTTGLTPAKVATEVEKAPQELADRVSKVIPKTEAAEKVLASGKDYTISTIGKAQGVDYTKLKSPKDMVMKRTEDFKEDYAAYDDLDLLPDEANKLIIENPMLADAIDSYAKITGKSSVDEAAVFNQLGLKKTTTADIAVNNPNKKEYGNNVELQKSYNRSVAKILSKEDAAAAKYKLGLKGSSIEPKINTEQLTFMYGDLATTERELLNRKNLAVREKRTKDVEELQEQLANIQSAKKQVLDILTTAQPLKTIGDLLQVRKHLSDNQMKSVTASGTQQSSGIGAKEAKGIIDEYIEQLPEVGTSLKDLNARYDSRREADEVVLDLVSTRFGQSEQKAAKGVLPRSSISTKILPTEASEIRIEKAAGSEGLKKIKEAQALQESAQKTVDTATNLKKVESNIRSQGSKNAKDLSKTILGTDSSSQKLRLALEEAGVPYKDIVEKQSQYSTLNNFLTDLQDTSKTSPVNVGERILNMSRDEQDALGKVVPKELIAKMREEAEKLAKIGKSNELLAKRGKVIKAGTGEGLPMELFGTAATTKLFTFFSAAQEKNLPHSVKKELVEAFFSGNGDKMSSTFARAAKYYKDKQNFRKMQKYLSKNVIPMLVAMGVRQTIAE